MRQSLGWAVLGLLVFGTATAASAEPWNARVSVLVSGYDTSLIDIVSGCLTQKLRRLNNIAVVDAEPAYYMRVMVIEHKTARDTGYTLSVVVSRTIQDDVLRNSVPDAARLAFLLTIYGNAEKIVDSWITSARHDDLEEACHKIVDTFYWGTLEQARNPRRRLGEVVYGLARP